MAHTEKEFSLRSHADHLSVIVFVKGNVEVDVPAIADLNISILPRPATTDRSLKQRILIIVNIRLLLNNNNLISICFRHQRGCSVEEWLAHTAVLRGSTWHTILFIPEHVEVGVVVVVGVG